MKLWRRASYLGAILAIAFFVIQAPAQEQKGKEEKKNGEAASKGDAAKGKTVFLTNCELCHEATSETAKVGPGLKGLFKTATHKDNAGKEHSHTVAFVREQIEKGGGSMPPMGSMVSGKDLDDLVAYLQTL
ncbi:MAG: hypothetical protein A3J28_15880 [Acidobacteria bacterium RIFCSPLOWO2_12_FULL_60_22]|nr:MAG: hypothetical protein A3J28_15880 [Acidobacteria bacterium RIFCSPLOWO2_12_FULL_60_22]